MQDNNPNQPLREVVVDGEFDLHEGIEAILDVLMEPSEGVLCEGQSEIYIERNKNDLGPHTYASREELRNAVQAMTQAIKDGK